MSNDIVDDVRTDADGFLLDSSEWSMDVAFELAASAGIDELTPRHAAVIEELRRRYKSGTAGLLPQIRTICASLDQEEDCVSQLFGDPAVAWRIAGLPKSAIDMSAYMPSSETV
ncbi:TusE/DsrC/DsvC family sulfur relay protein [Thiosocius teredinicola]|uniref:TusE/DsrC/DsvC family sulfur relay protein n=1 Tax=Thiosocius teredinicola TaxID=1973002 RepID=UPI000990C2FC